MLSTPPAFILSQDSAHWFGTDSLGRDVFSRVLYGSRISITAGLITVLISFGIGLLYGGGDFGRSICIAAGCGEDSDCTAGTLGALLGIMGGSAVKGNTTPAAEFNIYADPHAAQLVFKSGVPIVMCGLDVTHSTYITAREVEELAALGSVQARLAAYFMGSGIEENARQFRTGGAPLHDPCAMMYAIDRSLFKSKPCWIGVERHGKVTRGKTVTDAYSDAKRTANARLVTGSDREGFIRRMMELFSGYGPEMPDEKF